MLDERKLNHYRRQPVTGIREFSDRGTGVDSLRSEFFGFSNSLMGGRGVCKNSRSPIRKRREREEEKIAGVEINRFNGGVKMDHSLCVDCGGFGTRPGHTAEGDCSRCLGSGLDPEGPISEQIICEHAYHCDKVDCIGQTGRRFDPDEARFGPNLCNLNGRMLQVVEDVVVNPTYAKNQREV